MSKKTIKDIEEIKKNTIAKKVLSKDGKRARVTVHMGTCGIASGARDVYKALSDEIKNAKIKDVGIETTGCFGICSKEPLITVEVENQEPIVYEHMNAEKMKEVFEKHILGGHIVKEYAFARGKECQVKERIKNNGALPGEVVLDKTIHGIEEIPFFKLQEERVMRNRGCIDPNKIDDYIANDGYKGMIKALTEMSSEEIINEVLNSGLRGRGGAGFPTGLKWKFTAKSSGDIKYVLCNADEGDPGAYMDRSVLESDPHSIIEGMVIAAKAIGAHQGYIYCRAEYPLAIETLNKAIMQAKAYGLLGEDILGTGFDFNLEIYQGAGAFVCGEETALMRSIEGNRGNPRPRPPFPAEKGLWEKPTLLNNVETYANIGQIILKGSKWFSEIGTEKSKGTKVFSITGDINNVGCVEVPIGTSLKTIVYDIGGGVKDGKKFKAVQLGGPSGGCIPIKHLDTPIDYESLKDLGAIMGSGGLIVINEDKSAVEIAKYFMEFCNGESCGKCTPCREGTKQMLIILNRICSGQGKEADLEKLQDLANVIQKTALCALGQTAPNPVLSTIRYFRNEYEEVLNHNKDI